MLVSEHRSPDPVSTALLVRRVPLDAVVLRCQHQVLVGEIEPSDQPAVLPDLDLWRRRWERAAQPTQPKHRLAGRFGARVAQGSQGAQLGHPSHPAEAFDAGDELILAELPEPQHGIEARNRSIALLQPPEVPGRTDRRGHAKPVDLGDISGQQVALAAVGEPVAQASPVRGTKDGQRLECEVLVGGEDHLGTGEPAGVAVADDGVRRHDEAEARGPKRDRVAAAERRRRRRVSAGADDHGRGAGPASLC